MFLRINIVFFLMVETDRGLLKTFAGELMASTFVSPEFLTQTVGKFQAADEHFNTQRLYKCPGILLLYTLHAN